MDIILLIVSVILIVLSLLQGGKGDALSAFTGNKNIALFKNQKERGSEKVISRLTLIFGIIYFGLVIAIRAM